MKPALFGIAFLDKAISKRLLIATIIFLLLGSFCSPASAFNVTWATVKNSSNWSPVQDLNGENSIAASLDISSYGASGATGPDDSVYVACDGTYVYFRFLLNANPLVWSQSQQTWQISSNNCFEAFLYTGNEATLTSASVQTLTADLSKSNAVQLYSGTSRTPIPGDSIGLGPITQNGLVYTDNTGGVNYVTLTDTGIPNALDGKNDLFYLDFKIPFSWLAAQGITLNAPVRAFYGTSSQDNTLNKDYMIGNALDFTQTGLFTFGNPNVSGMIYDSRDTAPPSNAGIWYGGQALTVTGYGWPFSTALMVQIYDPTGGTRLWSGTVTSDASGNISGAPLMSIPLNWASGVYRINVVDPTTGISNYHDSFTIVSSNVAISKTVSPTQALESQAVTYTITVTNSGNTDAAMTTLTDTLPAGFTYKTGSTTGLTTSDPSVSGQTLAWSGSWTVALGGGTKTLSFQAVTPNTRGTFTNLATSSGTNFGTVSTGNTAPLQVMSPVMSLSKSADKASVKPGDTVTYSVTYSNVGDASAYTIVFLDNIPTNTTYVTSSAQGIGTTIQFSHDGGNTWNSSDLAPVTAIRWLISPLAPNAGGTLGFKVTVN